MILAANLETSMSKFKATQGQSSIPFNRVSRKLSDLRSHSFMHGSPTLSKCLKYSGVFNYDAGLMPYRRPVHTVVGKPIATTKQDNPANAEIERVQTLYIEELCRVWEEHRTIYGEGVNFRIIE